MGGGGGGGVLEFYVCFSGGSWDADILRGITVSVIRNRHILKGGGHCTYQI